MLPRKLENLRERLLCAGVAPRHVQRYVRELEEHHDDVLRAELAEGAGLDAARACAWARLGTEDDLAQNMLARPELRSAASRFPALFFGAGPLLAWLGAAIALACVLRLLPETSTSRTQQPIWLVDGAYALCVFYARILPVLLGVAVLAAAARRRLPSHWPVAGAALLDLFAGTLSVHLFAATALAPGQLGVSSSLLPILAPFSDAFGPIDLAAFVRGLLRAACLLALSWVAQRAVRRIARGRVEAGSSSQARG